MISASSLINILLGLGAFSMIAAAADFVQGLFHVDHRQRLAFLKAAFFAHFIFFSLSCLLAATSAARFVGQLLPVRGLVNQTLQTTQAKILLDAGNGWGWPHIVLGIYFLVLTVFFFRYAVAAREMARLRREAKPVDLFGRTVFVGSSIRSAFSYGLLRPEIFLPASYLAKPSRELEIVVRHESVHVKHRDPQFKLLSLLLRSLLFFSPAAFYLHRRLETEMEIECDRVTMRESGASVSEYGHLLIDFLSVPQKTNPLSAGMSNSDLQKRISAMKTKTMFRPFLSALCALGVLSGGAVAVAAVSGVSAVRDQYEFNIQIIVDGKVISNPQIISLAGEEAMIEVGSGTPPRSDLKISILANEAEMGPEFVDLKMQMKIASGSQYVRNNPHVVAKLGESTSIFLSPEQGQIEVRFVVVKK